MNGPKTDLGTADDLGAELDRLSMSQNTIGVPIWLAAVDGRLRDLDEAFAPAAAHRQVPSLYDLTATVDTSVMRLLTSERSAHGSGKWFISSRAIAAVLVIALLGASGVLSIQGSWFKQEHRSFSAMIPAAGTPTETAYVDSMVVTPSACTLPPLTRERYDEIVGTGTPPTEDELFGIRAAKADGLWLTLEPTIVNGAFTMTGGSSVPKEMALKLANAIANDMACLNADANYAAAGFLSDDALRMTSDPDAWFAGMEPGVGPTVTQFLELRYDQLRLLSDGRVVAVQILPFEVPPAGSPIKSVAIEGVMIVYVQTPDGWRLDFGQSGYLFHLPMSENAGTATPVTT